MSRLLDLDLGLVCVLFGPKDLIFHSLECFRGLDCPFKHNSVSRIIKMQYWIFIIFHATVLERKNLQLYGFRRSIMIGSEVWT